MDGLNGTEAAARFKADQRAAWADHGPLEVFSAVVAPRLVRFAGIRPGDRVLDVGCGSGVVALTAARAGAKVTGIDLTPELVAHARRSSSMARVEIDWLVGDAEELPFAEATFDVVVSQFGHIFAPRPDVVTGEMLRVLRRGGTIAFSAWPPELYVGRMFALLSRYAAQKPAIAPLLDWGEPNVVRRRLEGAVKDVVFDRDVWRFPMLTPQHGCASMEEGFGPVRATARALAADPDRLAAFRAELEELVGQYFDDNELSQGYLLARATRV